MRAPAGWISPAVLAASIVCGYAVEAHAAAPRLYHQPALQSPVRADPDDLLVLAGEGLGGDSLVFYAAATGDGVAAVPPKEIPAESSADRGTAPVVSAAGAPWQLTIRLPAAIDGGQTYRIWVRNSTNEWSNPVTINDPRPLWFSPSVAYASASLASLPRYIKVIGRNLQPRGSMPVRVRLSGRQDYLLGDALDSGSGAPIQRYAAALRLPETLAPGDYRVAASFDGTTWNEVPDQSFHVLPDPPRVQEFRIADPRFGACRADDGRDDTPCIQAAIRAASAAGGAAVVLGRGTWNVTSGKIELPPGVLLLGQGADLTRVLRHDGASGAFRSAAFTLLGANVVRGILFADERTFTPEDLPRPMLQLGHVYSTDLHPGSSPTSVRDVIITHNVFDKTDGAIVDAGSPIERLLVTFNLIGDYRLGLELGGNRFNVRNRFRIDDSIISQNVFMPGSYIDVEHGQGAFASELGASHRVDFSGNQADGASRRFLNSPADPPGWRAAFFWHMNGNDEMLMISDNQASCTGDKAGDGEAFALDNNANTFALPAARTVLAATDDTIRIAGPLKAVQNARSVDVSSYYAGHWVRIAAGPGVGQARQIVSYVTDAATGDVTFRVSAAWDVLPAASSTMTISREFWQVYLVGNTVDQRRPLCGKGNRTRPKGGAISLWAQSSDTVIEGNRQFDTDGIWFQQAYVADDPACVGCSASTTIPSFLDIRGNVIDGEYEWNSACSLSGIVGSYAASPTAASPPPLLGISVAIAHNFITQADGLNGGAITIQPTWYRGPAGYSGALVENLLIHHNSIAHVSGDAARAACTYGHAPRMGIHLNGPHEVDASALYKNRCDDVSIPLVDHGAHTLRVCDASEPPSCECADVR